MSSFLEWKDYKIVYKRYANLHFVCTDRKRVLFLLLKPMTSNISDTQAFTSVAPSSLRTTSF